ncbi:hypothetical protein ACI797_10405 [Geodermatophilus sp. SYSU D00691]
MSSADVDTVVPRRAHHLPAALAAVVAVGVVLAGAQPADERALPAAVLVLQVLLVAAWVVVTGAGVGTAVVGVAAAVGGVLALELSDRPALGDLLAVLGPAFLVVVLGQMLRRDRHDVVAGLATGVLLVCAVTALAVLLLLGRTDPSGGLVTTALLVVGAALVVGHLVDLVLPQPQLAADVPRGLIGLLLSVAAAVAVALVRRGEAGLADAVSAGTFGAVLGAVAALVAVAASYVAVETGGGRGRAVALPVLQAVLPLAACAPVALALQTAL